MLLPSGVAGVVDVQVLRTFRGTRVYAKIYGWLIGTFASSCTGVLLSSTIKRSNSAHIWVGPQTSARALFENSFSDKLCCLLAVCYHSRRCFDLLAVDIFTHWRQHDVCDAQMTKCEFGKNASRLINISKVILCLDHLYCGNTERATCFVAIGILSHSHLSVQLPLYVLYTSMATQIHITCKPALCQTETHARHGLGVMLAHKVHDRRVLLA